MLRFIIMILACGVASAHAQAQWHAVPATESGRAPAPDWLERIERELQGKETIDVLIEFKRDDVLTVPSRERATAMTERQAADSYVAGLREAVASAGRPLEADFRAKGMEVIESYDYIPIIHARITPEHLRRLAERDDIIAVHLNEKFKQEGMETEASERALIVDEKNKPALSATTTYTNADKAWAKGFRGQGYAIAVLDNGILATHEMFKNGKIVNGACFSSKNESTDESLCLPGLVSPVEGIAAASTCAGGDGVCDHGTHVAGIAAGNNGAALNPRRGIAPDSKIVAIQVFHRSKTAAECDGKASCLRASSSDILGALNWLLLRGRDYKVIAANLSLGGTTGYATHCDPISPNTSAINSLRAIGILTVIAAGNGGLVGQVSHPGCIKNAVTVSSVIDTNADFSVNHAAIVDLLAPGYAVTSAVSTSPTSYGSKSGTSMATPHVAGAFAILKSRSPEATPEQLEMALKATGPMVTSANWSWATPRIDIDQALDGTNQTPPLPGIALAGFSPGLYAGGTSYIRISNPTSSSGYADITVVQDRPRKILGTYRALVSGRASVQEKIKDIEINIQAKGLADSTLSLYVEANFPGFAQNIFWNAETQSLTNITVCKTTTVDPNTFFGNTHTALVEGYPSYILFHNRSNIAAVATLDIYDSPYGAWMRTVKTDPIEPNTSIMLPTVGALKVGNLPIGTTTFHVNFLLRPGFDGVIAHLVQNTRTGSLVDMTPKCPI